MRTQAGSGMGSPPRDPFRGNVKVRAVVIATFFADEDDRESAQGAYSPKNIVCDVLTYGGRYRSFLAKVPVVQHRHGLNDYTDLWIPRASTVDLSKAPLAAPVLQRTEGETTVDPRDLDGDHVLVEFLENDPMQPIINGSLAHPRSNYRLVKSDGESRRSRFRGVETSIDSNGNVRIDTTGANDGTLNDDGTETAADDSTHGRITVLVGKHTTFDVQGTDGTTQTYELALSDGQLEVRLQDGASMLLTGKDGSTNLIIGDGVMSAVLGERLQQYIDALVLAQKTFNATHVHPDGWGSTAPTGSDGTLPDYGTDINSTKVKLPDL